MKVQINGLMDSLLLVLFEHLRINEKENLGSTAKSVCLQICAGHVQLS